MQAPARHAGTNTSCRHQHVMQVIGLMDDKLQPSMAEVEHGAARSAGGHPEPGRLRATCAVAGAQMPARLVGAVDGVPAGEYGLRPDQGAPGGGDGHPADDAEGRDEGQCRPAAALRLGEEEFGERKRWRRQ